MALPPKCTGRLDHGLFVSASWEKLAKLPAILFVEPSQTSPTLLAVLDRNFPDKWQFAVPPPLVCEQAVYSCFVAAESRPAEKPEQSESARQRRIDTEVGMVFVEAPDRSVYLDLDEQVVDSPLGDSVSTAGLLAKPFLARPPNSS